MELTGIGGSSRMDAKSHTTFNADNAGKVSLPQDKVELGTSSGGFKNKLAGYAREIASKTTLGGDIGQGIGAMIYGMVGAIIGGIVGGVAGAAAGASFFGPIGATLAAAGGGIVGAGVGFAIGMHKGFNS